MIAVRQFQLRLPEDIRSRLEERAHKNRRSLHAEILHCLDRAVQAAPETALLEDAEGASAPTPAPSSTN